MVEQDEELSPPSPESPQQVVIGRLGAPYGIAGWHHVHSFTEPVANILLYNHWYVQQKKQWVLMEKVAGRVHGQGIVVHLKGIETPEQAARLTNSLIAIERVELAALAPDQFYWADLENLWVKTKEGKVLGRIDYLYENVGVDVMVVISDGKEHHIPFTFQEVVLAVDLATQTVTVDWEPLL